MPNLTLAIVHGVTGQVFFGMIVALAVFSTRRWRDVTVASILPTVGLDRSLTRVLVLLLIVQIVLGAVLRHIAGGLLIHISLAVVVVLFAIIAGVRAWGYYSEVPELKRLGNGLVILSSLQVGLGLGALVATGAERSSELPSVADVILTTFHQACGALLLACTVALMLWLHRLVAPVARPEPAP